MTTLLLLLLAVLAVLKCSGDRALNVSVIIDGGTRVLSVAVDAPPAAIRAAAQSFGESFALRVEQWQAIETRLLRQQHASALRESMELAGAAFHAAASHEEVLQSQRGPDQSSWQLWSNAVRLYRDAVTTAPSATNARFNLAVALHRRAAAAGGDGADTADAADALRQYSHVLNASGRAAASGAGDADDADDAGGAHGTGHELRFEALSHRAALYMLLARGAGAACTGAACAGAAGTRAAVTGTACGSAAACTGPTAAELAAADCEEALLLQPSSVSLLGSLLDARLAAAAANTAAATDALCDAAELARSLLYSYTSPPPAPAPAPHALWSLHSSLGNAHAHLASAQPRGYSCVEPAAGSGGGGGGGGGSGGGGSGSDFALFELHAAVSEHAAAVRLRPTAVASHIALGAARYALFDALAAHARPGCGTDEHGAGPGAGSRGGVNASGCLELAAVSGPSAAAAGAGAGAGIGPADNAWRGARWHYRAALRHRPSHSGALVNLALAVWTGDYDNDSDNADGDGYASAADGTANDPAPETGADIAADADADKQGGGARYGAAGQAALLLERAVQLQPALAVAHANLARVLATQASRLHSAGGGAGAASPRAKAARARLLRRARRASAAALALAPGDAGAHFGAGMLATADRRWADAVSHYAHAAGLPQRAGAGATPAPAPAPDADAFCNLGYALSKLGSDVRALPPAAQAEAQAQHAAAWKLRACGAYARATELAPGSTAAWYNLGELAFYATPAATHGDLRGTSDSDSSALPQLTAAAAPGGGGRRCAENGGAVRIVRHGRWADEPDVEAEPVFAAPSGVGAVAGAVTGADGGPAGDGGAAFRYTLRPPAGLLVAGSAGVVADAARCRLFEQVHGPLAPHADAMRALGDARWPWPWPAAAADPRLKRARAQGHVFGPAATLLQMSGANFFHWVAEATPRLLALRPLLLHSWKSGQGQGHGQGGEQGQAHELRPAPIRLLLPGRGRRAAQRYVNDTLRLLGLGWAPAHLHFADPGTVLHVHTLTVIDWRARDVGVRPGHAEHFNAPPALLRAARAALVGAVPIEHGRGGDGEGEGGGESGPTIVLLQRRDQGRGGRAISNHDELAAALRLVAGALGVGARVVVHGGASASLDDDIALFRHARVIVGVHGAGLANMLFCPEGAAVVELAVPEPCCAMYARMARALRLRYFAHSLGANAFHRAHVHADVRALSALVRRALGLQEGVLG
eukprot:g4901.t1